MFHETKLICTRANEQTKIKLLLNIQNFPFKNEFVSYVRNENGRTFFFRVIFFKQKRLETNLQYEKKREKLIMIFIIYNSRVPNKMAWLGAQHRISIWLFRVILLLLTHSFFSFMQFQIATPAICIYLLCHLFMFSIPSISAYSVSCNRNNQWQFLLFLFFVVIF